MTNSTERTTAITLEMLERYVNDVSGVWSTYTSIDTVSAGVFTNNNGTWPRFDMGAEPISMIAFR